MTAINHGRQLSLPAQTWPSLDTMEKFWSESRSVFLEQDIGLDGRPRRKPSRAQKERVRLTFFFLFSVSIVKLRTVMLKSIHKRTKNVCLVLYQEIRIYPITDLQARPCRYNLCPQLLHFLFSRDPLSPRPHVLQRHARTGGKGIWRQTLFMTSNVITSFRKFDVASAKAFETQPSSNGVLCRSQGLVSAGAGHRC